MIFVSLTVNEGIIIGSNRQPVRSYTYMNMCFIEIVTESIHADPRHKGVIFNSFSHVPGERAIAKNVKTPKARVIRVARET